MLETLSKLAQEASVEKIIVSIEAVDDVKSRVTIQSIFKPLNKDASESTLKVRDALSRPILISGLAAEIEAKLDSLLMNHVDNVKIGAQSLESQMDSIKEAANAAESESEKSTNGKNKKEKKTSQSSSKVKADLSNDSL